MFRKWRRFEKVEKACGIRCASGRDVAEVWNVEMDEHYPDARDERPFERGEFSAHDRRSTKATGPGIAIRRVRKGGGTRLGEANPSGMSALLEEQMGVRAYSWAVFMLESRAVVESRVPAGSTPDCPQHNLVRRRAVR